MQTREVLISFIQVCADAPQPIQKVTLTIPKKSPVVYDLYQNGRSMFLAQLHFGKSVMVLTVETEMKSGSRSRKSYDISQVFEAYATGEIKNGEKFTQEAEGENGLRMSFSYWLTVSASVISDIYAELPNASDKYEFQRTLDEFYTAESVWVEEYLKQEPTDKLEALKSHYQQKQEELRDKIDDLKSEIKEIENKPKPVFAGKLVEQLLVLVLLFLVGFALGELYPVVNRHFKQQSQLPSAKPKPKANKHH